MFRSQQEFERIAMPEAQRLLRFALGLTHDTSSAEDLVQETLLKAWRGFHQFRESTNARAWLFRILMNAFYEQHRRNPGEAVGLEETGRHSGILEQLEMNQALDALASEHRTVLLLGVVEGFSCREVSDILAVPMGTVMSRLSRARQALREKLAPERGVAAAAQKDNG